MSLFSPKINARSMAVFCRQMAQMYDAGIPVQNGLKLAAESTPDRKLRHVVENMYLSISSGATLSQAIEQERKYWPNVFIELVGAGELGGRLKTIFYELARYYDQRVEMRRKILGALIYPTVQIVILWLAASLILAIRRMQKATGFGFDLEKLLEQYAKLQIQAAAAMVIIVVVVVILSRLGRWQWIWGALKTFVWPFRKMGRTLAMARFSQALGLLLGSGIGVKTATEHAARTADNPYITASLIQALPRLDQGATLTEALSPCRYLDPRVRETLYVGEQSGTLPVSLAKVAEQLDLEAMAAAHVATRVFEITVILLVLLIGGWFVISFWTGYYNNLFEMLDI